MSQLGTKKRVVFTTWGSFGDLHPHMALALELQERGYHSVIATSPIYREKVEAAGIAFHPVRPDLPPPDAETSAEIIRRASDARGGPSYLFRELLVPHLRETYADTLAAVTAEGGADLLVSHQVPLTAPLVAEKTGVKWISSVLFPIAFTSAYDPPTPPQLPALRTLAATHPLVARTLFGLGKWTTKSWVEPIERLRKELGLARSPNPIFEGQHSPTLVLALFSKLLARIQPDFPSNTMITGFPFYDRKDEQPPAPELLRFLDEGEPPVLFTLGSSLVWIAKDFYRVSIEAARKLERRALLLIGDKRNLPQTKLPDGIAAFDYAPHSLVMPRASVIVHQGGIGTTGQALRAGRPMLIVPYGQDQPDNAHRCVRLGVGRALSPSRLTVPRVVGELSELLDNLTYREQAAKVGQRVREENGAKTACDAIEQVLHR
ncbi:MAG TPA: glycosyltransferase [Pyrinomonadaceae bacterium]|jgi:MGT family glycosyltransferase|nr:glycosyltransferase [Pyrinomonadaceae bacterium]